MADDTRAASRKRKHRDTVACLTKKRKEAQERVAVAQAKLYAAMAEAHADPVGKLTYEELMEASGLGRMRVADILREQREVATPGPVDA